MTKLSEAWCSLDSLDGSRALHGHSYLDPRHIRGSVGHSFYDGGPDWRSTLCSVGLEALFVRNASFNKFRAGRFV